MYTELHARSAFSFMEGASIPEQLASACSERGMTAMAVLDRDGGGMERLDFIRQPKKDGIRGGTSARKLRPLRVGVMHCSWNPAKAIRICAAPLRT